MCGRLYSVGGQKSPTHHGPNFWCAEITKTRFFDLELQNALLSTFSSNYIGGWLKVDERVQMTTLRVYFLPAQWRPKEIPCCGRISPSLFLSNLIFSRSPTRTAKPKFYLLGTRTRRQNGGLKRKNEIKRAVRKGMRGDPAVVTGAPPTHLLSDCFFFRFLAF